MGTTNNDHAAQSPDVAVIGVYTGREDNIFWRRVQEESGARVEAAGAKLLGERDAEPLGRDIIHSVTNLLSRCTGAIHVYGGDFFFGVPQRMGSGNAPRTELRHGEKSAPIRGSEPGLRQFMTTTIQSIASILL
jgi:predicted metal-dependent enzyme (double-stranded beta helix superfamily)